MPPAERHGESITRRIGAPAPSRKAADVGRVVHPRTVARVAYQGASWMQTLKPANGPARRTDWPRVDWRKADRIVRNLRQRSASFGRHKRTTNDGFARYRSSCCGATPTFSYPSGG